MADSILRLKVDSQEYDQKIKRAAEGIQRYAQKCREAGGTLEHLDDGVEEFVRALGQMDTVSKSAKGSVNELTRAFTDLSVQYNRLTDEEKQSPFGKALSSSLDELKGRIQSGNVEIKNIGESLNGGGGLKDALDAVAGKFGLNIGQLTKFGGALAAAKTALDTVKGAIESTEATHDALARAISVTDNVTNQFLRSLATADFSNFINGLQSIIDKTIDAYNAMDEFESYAARFQPWQQAKESQIQTKIMQARAAKAKGENDRAEQLNNEAKQLIQELAKSTKAYGEKQTTGGFATIRSLMGQVNISNQQIAWYADPKNWEQAKQKAQQFANTQERIKQLEKDISGYRRPGETEMGYAMRVGAAQNEKNRLEEMLRRDQSLKRAYTMQNLRDSGDSKQAQQFRQALGNIYGNTLAESRIESLMARADRMEGMLTRAGGGGGGGKGGRTTQKVEDIFPSGSLKDLQLQLQDLQKAQALVTDPTQWQAYQQAIDGVNEKITILKGILPKDSRAEFRFETITDDVMAKLREVEGVHISTKPVTITADTSEAMDALKNVEGIHIDPKTLVITADNAEALEKAKAINGVTVDDKTLRIVADTSEAMQQVQQLTSSIENQEVVIRPTVAFAKELPSLPTLVPKIEMPKMPDIKPLKMQIKAELDAQALKADEQTLNTILKDSIQNGINGMDFQLGSLSDQIAKGIDVPDEKWQAIIEQYNELREQIGLDPIQIELKTGGIKNISQEAKTAATEFSKAASAIGSVGSALQSIEDPGAKVAGIIAQAIATIAQTFAASLKGTFTPWDWIAGAAAGTATMISTIAAIKSATASERHAGGGFIGGKSYSGDNVMMPIEGGGMAALSSGELVLNRAQQSNLATQLEGGAGRSVHVTGMLRGEDIVLVADRWGRRTGKGELAFWK